MKTPAVEAIYEDGLLRLQTPLDLPSGASVRVFIETPEETAARVEALLKQLAKVFEGLAEEEITAIEEMALGHRRPTYQP